MNTLFHKFGLEARGTIFTQGVVICACGNLSLTEIVVITLTYLMITYLEADVDWERFHGEIATCCPIFMSDSFMPTYLQGAITLGES